MRAARSIIIHKQITPTHSLLSLNTVGEIIDIIWLLRGDLFTKKYVKIVVQSACILLLTTASLLSALLARYSTRTEIQAVPRKTSGLLAERTLQSGSAGATANQTLYALKRANFPPNQLLDFLPDLDTQWQYQEDQWTNSSWSMNCTSIELTEIPHANVQDCSPNLLDQVPYLNKLFSDWPRDKWQYGWSGSGYEYNLTEWKDYNLFLFGVWGVDMYSNDIFSPGDCGCPMRELNIRVFWVHLQDVGKVDSNDTSCIFRRSPAKTLRYTGTTCHLVKNATSIPKEDLFLSTGAAPDIVLYSGIPSAYNMQYGSRLIRQSMQDLPISVLSGAEMVQFYQAYLIAKDTELSRQRRVSRTINVFLPVTQISLVCVVLCCVAGFVVFLGLVSYFVFVTRYRENLGSVPQSKLDWMVKFLRLENEQKEVKEACFTTAGSEIGTDYSTASTLVAYRTGGAALSTQNDHITNGRPRRFIERNAEDLTLISSNPSGL